MNTFVISSRKIDVCICERFVHSLRLFDVAAADIHNCVAVVTAAAAAAGAAATAVERSSTS